MSYHPGKFGGHRHSGSRDGFCSGSSNGFCLSRGFARPRDPGLL